VTLIYFPPKNATPARSNLVSIPPGCVPSDMLYSSPIISENAGGNMDASFGFGAGGAPGATAGGGAGGGGADDFGGVDPNMDPELAMALRVSMEEERARQESEAAADPAPDAGAAASNTGMDVDTSGRGATAAAASAMAAPADSVAPGAAAVGGESEDEELLQQALALSMNDGPSAGETMDTDGGMDEEMMMALQMSMQVDNATPAPSASTPASELTADPGGAANTATSAAAEEGATGAAAAPSGSQFHDASFVTNMLASLPGVDPSDPRIQQALQQIQNSKDAEKKDDKESK
jgi:26S proteasome regulatory subunit N10